ncbi:MAG: hypothetical protein F2788_05660, partial [Actinobacteria bacterium]|nr:hypothetical protein [Actinomycetota bacterium]
MSESLPEDTSTSLTSFVTSAPTLSSRTRLSAKRSRMTTTEKSAGWRVTAGIALPLMALISRITVRGMDNIPQKGAFILAPCHFSAIDPVVMGVALWKAGRTPRFMAKESLFRVPILGSVLRGLGQIPVDR